MSDQTNRRYPEGPQIGSPGSQGQPGPFGASSPYWLPSWKCAANLTPGDPSTLLRLGAANASYPSKFKATRDLELTAIQLSIFPTVTAGSLSAQLYVDGGPAGGAYIEIPVGESVGIEDAFSPAILIPAGSVLTVEVVADLNLTVSAGSIRPLVSLEVKNV